MTTNNVNMKYIKLTFFVLFCSVLFSCSTTQTINVCGEPNSDIYSPEMVRLGTIDNSGNAKITLSSDGYYAYLLSKAPTSDKLIPFAIDYKNKNYTGTLKNFNEKEIILETNEETIIERKNIAQIKTIYNWEE